MSYMKKRHCSLLYYSDVSPKSKQSTHNVILGRSSWPNVSDSWLPVNGDGQPPTFRVVKKSSLMS